MDTRAYYHALARVLQCYTARGTKEEAMTTLCSLLLLGAMQIRQCDPPEPIELPPRFRLRTEREDYIGVWNKKSQTFVFSDRFSVGRTVGTFQRGAGFRYTLTDHSAVWLIAYRHPGMDARIGMVSYTYGF